MKEGKLFRKKAAAIGYDLSKDKAPRLLAKGSGIIAEKIIEKAREHDIQIKEDKDLVEVLATLDLHEEIPESMYKAVAQLLAEIYRINARL
ncbi:flagellar biosynthesis protein FlhB [Geovibrio thiophilus]|uniref:Flagellar biosynthesis protein FlhB n=1 Tax=Geovibrio thiophilus TaxID=139438 RepID=A0A3R5X104_9BACT|nr:EscU/YscU/HrcU family type III secretion system export apparatus switch protein [Geovibrio thiophilus]QAR31874.1 flagellar biosynthesis protein FlhB [Geovibrio thiophilus]